MIAIVGQQQYIVPAVLRGHVSFLFRQIRLTPVYVIE